MAWGVCNCAAATAGTAAAATTATGRVCMILARYGCDDRCSVNGEKCYLLEDISLIFCHFFQYFHG